MSTISRLVDRGLAKPPRWLPTNVSYETIMGSVAYGVSSDTSDFDIYSFCIPPRDNVFPHLRGDIIGFGNQQQRFEQYQEHHIEDKDALGGKGRSYDITCFSIVKFFQLAMENNPNIVDSIFTPTNCVLHSTNVGNMVRENRRLFLHKGAWPKFKGYAYSQLHKMSTKSKLDDKRKDDGEGASHRPGGKRRALVEAHGYDTKFAYHVVRLLLEVEQIMVEGDIDLQRGNEQLKAIRRGEWTEGQIRQWASDKEKALEEVYHTSSLRYNPDEPAIKQLLVNCLEEHYGDLSGVLVNPDATTVALRNIQAELDKVRSLL